jgi:protein-disulfide isomerase
LKSCTRIFFFPLLAVVTCFAQLSPNELSQRIEHEVRAYYEIPDDVRISVSPLHASDFPDYDALSVTFEDEHKKKMFDFLVSKDQKTLIRLTRMDLSKDPYAEKMQKIDVKGRPVRGNPDAKVVVVSYDDFECPFCSRAHQALFPELLKEYGDRVAFIYKDFPLTDVHPWAVHAAIDANCLASQRGDAYWDFADYIHGNQAVVNSEKGRDNQFAALDRIATTEGAKFHVDSNKLQECIKAQKDDAVQASIKEGEALGVDGTPTMFVNGKLVNGARSADELRAILDHALQEAGVSPPPHPAASAAPSPSSASAPAAR